MNDIQAILVDLDGTLARTVNANWHAYNQALKEVGVEITRRAFDAKMHGRNWREFLPEIIAEAGIDADAERIALRKTEIYRTSLLTIEINTALVSALRLARKHGLKVGLVTSASSASVHRILEAHDLRDIFQTIVTGDDVRNHKPHPEPYVRAAEDLEVPIGSCLVYEDSEVGMISASQAGAQVIQVVF